MVGLAAFGLIASLSAVPQDALPRASALQDALPRPGVRFHHLHYAVADPASAMNEAASKLEGARVIAQGLGVGVRFGEEFVLYERAGEEDSRVREAADVASEYASAVAWLREKGIDVQPPALSSSRVVRAPAGAFRHLGFVAADFDAVIAKIGAAPVTRTPDVALFDARGRQVEIVRDTDAPDAFWCSMHPDIRSPIPGECPACRMALTPIPPPKVGEYRLNVSVEPAKGGATELVFTVAEPDTGARVREFITVHEERFHLFIVSRDLEYFAHVHPMAVADGSFFLRHTLPAGEYMLIADFLPATGTPQMVQRAIIVPGNRGGGDRGSGVGGRGSTFEAGGIRGVLEAENLVPGKESQLKVTFSDVATGAPVTDLEPYLGAPAHMLMVRSDLSDAAHEHPEETAAGGPTVSFHPIIPAAGDYRLWVQVQRSGTVLTFAFGFRAAR